MKKIGKEYRLGADLSRDSSVGAAVGREMETFPCPLLTGKWLGIKMGDSVKSEGKIWN